MDSKFIFWKISDRLLIFIFWSQKYHFSSKNGNFENKIWKKFKIWNFHFLFDHFNGPQLFVGGRTSLENGRNGVFRSSRYGLKKIPSKFFKFWQSYSLRLLSLFYLPKKWHLPWFTFQASWGYSHIFSQQYSAMGLAWKMFYDSIILLDWPAGQAGLRTWLPVVPV